MLCFFFIYIGGFLVVDPLLEFNTFLAWYEWLNIKFYVGDLKIPNTRPTKSDWKWYNLEYPTHTNLKYDNWQKI